METDTLYLLFDVGLWLAVVGQVCILVAASLMPQELDWKNTLTNLSPFNRKVFYNFHYSLLMLMVLFLAAAIILHDRFLEGDAEALWVAAIMASLWLYRPLFAMLFFKKADMPNTPKYAVFFPLFTGLYSALAIVYWGLILWHALGH